MALLLGGIADDYTGATDLSGALAEAGLRVVQVFGRPKSGTSVPDADAVVVGMKTRSIPSAEAIRDSLAALDWLRRAKPRQVYFKYCSTFDSTPNGNIGPVAGALLDAMNCRFTVACPAYPANGRTVYNGHLFVGDRLLNESGMEKHPLNPMTDPDLVRVLQAQTHQSIGLIPLSAVRGDLQGRLGRLEAEGVGLAVLDAVSDDDLIQAAAVLIDRPLLTGGTGLAAALPRAYRDVGLLPAGFETPRTPDVQGSTAVIAGSCSAATRAQVEEFGRDHQLVIVDPLKCFGQDIADAIVSQIPSWPAIVASTAPPDRVAAAHAKYGVAPVAEWVEQTLAAVATRLVARGVRRLVVAGGETSGAVVAALGVTAVRVGPRICPGVPWCETLGEPRLALALKSGNFGPENFFRSALEMLS